MFEWGNSSANDILLHNFLLDRIPAMRKINHLLFCDVVFKLKGWDLLGGVVDC
jgi:hypothetical protein